MATEVKSDPLYDRFMAASKFVASYEGPGKVSPSNDLKLKCYALYKQGTKGVCTTSRPSVLNVVERAKWDAWKALNNMSKDDAQRQYLKVVEDISPNWAQLAGYDTVAPAATAPADSTHTTPVSTPIKPRAAHSEPTTPLTNGTTQDIEVKDDTNGAHGAAQSVLDTSADALELERCLQELHALNAADLARISQLERELAGIAEQDEEDEISSQDDGEAPLAGSAATSLSFQDAVTDASDGADEMALLCTRLEGALTRQTESWQASYSACVARIEALERAQEAARRVPVMPPEWQRMSEFVFKHRAIFGIGAVLFVLFLIAKRR